MSKTQDVHGHKVDFDDDAKHGVEFLDHRLEYQEAEIFFRQAKSRGSAEFEDQDGRDYTLQYDPSGRYSVLRRKKSSGWF